VDYCPTNLKNHQKKKKQITEEHLPDSEWDAKFDSALISAAAKHPSQLKQVFNLFNERTVQKQKKFFFVTFHHQNATRHEVL